MYRALLKMMPAGETVTLSTAFFLPQKRLLRPMRRRSRDRRRDRLKFRLLVNAPEAQERDKRIVARAAQPLLRQLSNDRPGAFEIYEWMPNVEGNATAVHHKVASFGRRAGSPRSIGSSNLDAQSLRHNAECALLIYDERSAAAFDRILETDLSRSSCRRFSNDKPAARRSLEQRFLRRFLGWVL